MRINQILKKVVTIQLFFLEYYLEFVNIKAICKILFQNNAIKTK